MSATISQRLDPDSICSQASSLRYLVVEYLNSWDQEVEDADCMYDATELEVLSKACSRIEELGLSCAQIDFTEWPILEPFAWRPAAAQTPQEKELVKFLVRTQLPRETPLNIKGRYCHISESSCASNDTISTRCDGRCCNGKRISRAPIEVPAVRRANPEILGSAPFVDRAVGFQSHACDSRLPWDHSGRQRSQIPALLLSPR